MQEEAEVVGVVICQVGPIRFLPMGEYPLPLGKGAWRAAQMEEQHHLELIVPPMGEALATIIPQLLMEALEVLEVVVELPRMRGELERADLDHMAEAVEEELDFT